MSEFAWKDEFANKIDEVGISDTWDLCFDMNLTKQNKGLISTQYTFGSFRCSRCARKWNSSKVFILFLLNQNKRPKNGTVRMRIYKQGCERCNHREENPTITSDNIERAVCNLVQKIQNEFYGVNDKYQDLKPQIFGPLDGPHNRKLCEACRCGLCEQMPSGEHKEMENEGSALPGVLAVLAVGIGALALMYFSKNDDNSEKKKKAVL